VYVAPRSPVEQLLAQIWSEVLRVQRVGIEDDFFELGGDSIQATRVIARMREMLGLEIPLRILFDSPTVSKLAARSEEIKRSGTRELDPPR